MRILAYILELLVLAFITAAFISMSRQSSVTLEQQEQSADSASVILLDKLNDSAYFNQPDTLVTDSIAK